MIAECGFYPSCSGCQLIGKDYETQRLNKIADLSKRISTFDKSEISINWLTAGYFGIRDRFDFVWDNGRAGLYSHEQKQIVDIASCGQLSPVLAEWFLEFRKINWPIRKGSIRLRVGPDGNRGAWLDFANEDIKKLLDEKNILLDLLAKSVVEIGQKRKVLKLVGEELKLRDPESHIWFESWCGSEKVGLYSHIGSFTQPSIKANQVLLAELGGWVRESGLLRASEFGSGIGNLSVMLLGTVETLNIYESDTLSVEAFKKTLSSRPDLFSGKKINFNVGNFHKETSLDFISDEILLVNPPRSGLRDFVKTIGNSSSKPRAMIYMSCSPDSWTEDGTELMKLGYKLSKISIMDQFPQTSHYEVLSYWKLG
jgi:23S rRNA (uracil1939-C5)-methyltransferase